MNQRENFRADVDRRRRGFEGGSSEKTKTHERGRRVAKRAPLPTRFETEPLVPWLVQPLMLLITDAKVEGRVSLDVSKRKDEKRG